MITATSRMIYRACSQRRISSWSMSTFLSIKSVCSCAGKLLVRPPTGILLGFWPGRGAACKVSLRCNGRGLGCNRSDRTWCCRGIRNATLATGLSIYYPRTSGYGRKGNGAKSRHLRSLWRRRILSCQLTILCDIWAPRIGVSAFRVPQVWRETLWNKRARSSSTRLNARSTRSIATTIGIVVR